MLGLLALIVLVVGIILFALSNITVGVFIVFIAVALLLALLGGGAVLRR